jgi:hypothetical protein
MPYGRTLAATSIMYPTRVSADGCPRYKAGGVTLDLTTLTAASGSDVTLGDGSVVKANNQYLRYGQVLCKITTSSVQTLTGTATGGTFTLTLLRPDTQQNVTTAALAFNASAATVLAAIQAVMGPNQVTSSSGGPLGTGAVTLNFNAYVPIATVNAALLTGGTVTPAVTTAGASSGKFGPYDPAASDGRQTLTRGDCFILDETFLVTPSGSQLPAGNDVIGSAIDGGLVYIDRVLHSGVATHTLALGPTLAEVLTAFPAIAIVRN